MRFPETLFIINYLKIKAYSKDLLGVAVSFYYAINERPDRRLVQELLPLKDL